MNAASREECARLEDLGLDVVVFEAIFVMLAIAERLVAGTSAPKLCLHYFSIDND